MVIREDDLAIARRKASYSALQQSLDDEEDISSGYEIEGLLRRFQKVRHSGTTKLKNSSISLPLFNK
jgi:hypothetical protein